MKIKTIIQDDEYGSMEDFRQTAASDILKRLGPMSKKEYDYYENLKPRDVVNDK